MVDIYYNDICEIIKKVLIQQKIIDQVSLNFLLSIKALEEISIENDFGLDCLDRIELICCIEAEGIDLPFITFEEIEEMESVSDLLSIMNSVFETVC